MESVLLVAHRTPSSRAACERLAAAGADVFEADIQIDRHERLVVSHYLPLGGRLLERDNWRIRWHTAARRDPELAHLTTGVVPERSLVLLDLKETSIEARTRLVSTIAGTLIERDRFRVCSPYADDLRVLRDKGFRTWRTVRDREEMAGVRADGELEDDAVTIRHSLLTPDLLSRLHDQVPNVVAWTINDVDRARRMRDLGVDGVTTDRAAVMRALSQ